MDQEVLENIVKLVLNQMSSATVEQEVGSSDAIPVELSGRHVHLSEDVVQELFGAPLTHAKDLSQPGQYLCQERVRLVGPHGVIDNVAVLGPARSSSQVEISLTDARILGISAPVRQSGDVAGSPGIVLTAGKNLVGLPEGVIVAARHIHMSPADAQRYGLVDKQKVEVSIDSERPAIFKDVSVRVNPAYRLAMHIDFDEGNSCGLGKNAQGQILSVAKEG